MKRPTKTLAILLSLMFTIGMTACGSSGKGPAGDNTTAAQNSQTDGASAENTDSAKKDVSIYILSCREELDASSDEFKAYDVVSKKLGYKHELEIIDDDTYKTKIRVMLQANELPDIFYTWGGSYSADFLKAGALYPVEDVVKESGYKFHDLYVRPGEDGHVYWVATAAAEAYCLFYNKNVLKKVGIEAPTTWNELIKAVEACKKAGVSALGLGNKDRWEGDLVYNMLVLRQDRNAFDNAVHGKASFTDNPFLASAEQVLTLVKSGAFQSGYTQATNDECGQLLLEGQIAMYPTGPWMISNFDKVDYIGFVPFPATGTEDAYAACCGNSTDCGSVISANSKHPREAAQFAIEYSKSLNDLNAKSGKLTFMETDVKSEVEASELVKSYADFLAGLEYNQLWWFTYLDALKGEPMRDLSQQLFAGDITAQDFVKELADIMK